MNSHLYYTGGVHHAPIQASASGDTEIVAAISGKRIVVLSYTAVGATAVGVAWKSASTVIGGKQEYPDTGGAVKNHNPLGWFITAAGEALNINLDGAVQVGGELVYQVVE